MLSCGLFSIAREVLILDFPSKVLIPLSSVYISSIWFFFGGEGRGLVMYMVLSNVSICVLTLVNHLVQYLRLLVLCFFAMTRSHTHVWLWRFPCWKKKGQEQESLNRHDACQLLQRALCPTTDILKTFYENRCQAHLWHSAFSSSSVINSCADQIFSPVEAIWTAPSLATTSVTCSHVCRHLSACVGHDWRIWSLVWSAVSTDWLRTLGKNEVCTNLMDEFIQTPSVLSDMSQKPVGSVQRATCTFWLLWQPHVAPWTLQR